MAKRPSKTEKLRAQLAEVQRQLEEAEQAEREDRLKKIEQSIRRSGVLDQDIPLDEIEAALRAVVERARSLPETADTSSGPEDEPVATAPEMVDTLSDPEDELVATA